LGAAGGEVGIGEGALGEEFHGKIMRALSGAQSTAESLYSDFGMGRCRAFKTLGHA